MDFLSLMRTPVPYRLCPYCLGIWTLGIENLFEFNSKLEIYQVICPVCKHPIVSDERDSLGRPLFSSVASFVNLGATSAGIAHDAIKQKQELGEKPNLFRTLTYLLARAQHFVSFLSWRIDPWFLGALAVTAQRANIGVLGIATGMNLDDHWVQENMVKPAEVLDLPHDFQVRLVSLNDYEMGIGSHAKMIIIDGAFMFHGSTNMNVNAWFKAADDRDVLQYKSNPSEIMEFHNRYFSPVWARLEESGRYSRLSQEWHPPQLAPYPSQELQE